MKNPIIIILETYFRKVTIIQEKIGNLEPGDLILECKIGSQMKAVVIGYEKTESGEKRVWTHTGRNSLIAGYWVYPTHTKTLELKERPINSDITIEGLLKLLNNFN